MQKRLFWPDLIRAAACFLVVVDHAAATPLYFIGRIPESEWTVAAIIGATARCCVPLFFMISGYLFYAREPAPLTEMVTKRVLRLLWPLLFFSVLGYLWRNHVLHPVSSDPGFLLHKAYYHLWFFYAMIAVSLIAAVIRPIDAKPFTAVGFILLLMVLLPGNLAPFGAHTDLFLMNDLGVYLCYFLLGHYAGKLSVPETFGARFGFGAGYLVATAFVALAFRETSLAAGRLDMTFYHFPAIPVIAQTVFAFLFLRSVAGAIDVRPLIATPIRKVAGVSLGIYGLHALVLDYFMEKQGFSGLHPTVLIGVTERLVIAFLGAFALALLLRLVDRKGYVS